MQTDPPPWKARPEPIPQSRLADMLDATLSTAPNGTFDVSDWNDGHFWQPPLP